MTDSSEREKSRCLFVISQDFGELGFAHSLLAGSHFTDDSCLLLPQHLYDLNRGRLPCASEPYSSFDDIRAHTESHSPDIVILLSGYLFWPNKIASISALKQWLVRLRARKCVVATSDPFLGLTGAFRPGHFSEEVIWSRPVRSWPGKLLRYVVVKAAQVYNMVQYRRIYSALKSTAHLYAMPVDHFNTLRKRQCHGFWNPALVQVRSPSSTEAAPVWLFVLSQIDYQVQCGDLGKSRFVELLGKQLARSKDCGRHPILLCPSELIEHMQQSLPSHLHSSLQSNKSYQEFQELLVSAEHVFYWNMLSHSMYMRLILEQPIHFFARGHVEQMFPTMHERAIRTYYDGIEPALNDLAEPLDPEKLIEQDTAMQKNMVGLLSRMRLFDSPERIVDEWLGR